MSWICPNCSSFNEDTQKKCSVCGMDKTVPALKTDPVEGKIVFSDFEAVVDSVKNFFHRKPAAATTGSARRSERTRRAPYEPRTRTERTREKSGDKKREKMIHFSSGFAKPWPEHNIKFDIAAIKDKGYVRSEQKSMGGINGYCFYKEDGTSRFIRVEMALVQKIANKV